ncbi:Galactokinase [Candidatus Promineifilum breve]|uniref:Galactokinase n=1 Tax=Candidatus Promineifilum breve TaxID=1806508 RepID=A0A160T419_9CHLR|nr:galactokinase [Candidatus Promineifilum breve]CUS04981.2 Galactokinase [Candidatus Promineifilum breve]
MSVQSSVVSRFTNLFGEPPTYVVRAPGRVNLIGEHTDYNDGFVLPMAIDRAVWIALRPRPDQRVILHADDFDDHIEFYLNAIRYESAGWWEYVKGVAHALNGAGYTMRGWEGVMAGDVPIGAGLSSSAAVEMATARAFAAVGRWPWDAAQMALAGQRAENEWVGMKCGIMDQMISAAGRRDHALLIDCRSLATELVPLPPQTAVVILDTATRRGLVDSAYNERRAQCEAAAAFFGVPALRDVDMATFEGRAAELDDLTRRRARHVISENARTLAAAEALRHGDAAAMGRLMNASHASMRDDFEISRPEMDVMVALAQAAPGCYGARMTGGGFGGAAVALVRAAEAERFAVTVATAYHNDTRLEPQVTICQATDGASVVAGRL